MKKILFFIAMVAMIAAMASAQIAVTASGSATTSFGVDLDDMDTGFTFDGSAEISIAPEIDMDSAASAVEDGDTVYGEFSISGITLKATYPQTIDQVASIYDDDGNLLVDGTGQNIRTNSNYLTLAYDSFAAKIVLGDLTINLYDAPETEVGFNDDIANAVDYSLYDGIYGGDDNANDADAEFHPGGLGADSIPANAGIELVYAIPDIADINVDVMSHDTWVHADAGDLTDNEYAFKVAVDLKAVENLILAAAINFCNYEADEFIAVGGKLGYTIAIGDEDSIVPSVGVTYKTDDPDGELGVSGGVMVKIAGIALSGNVGYYDTATTGLDYTIALDLGLVDGLTVQAAFEEKDGDIETDGMAMGIYGKLAYDIAAGDLTITPAAYGSYDDPDTEVDDNEGLYAKVDISVSGLIDNTTFKLEWDSNDLFDNDGLTDGVMGQIVLSTTVSL